MIPNTKSKATASRTRARRRLDLCSSARVGAAATTWNIPSCCKIFKKALGDDRPNYNCAECFLEDRFGDLDFIVACCKKLPAPRYRPGRGPWASNDECGSPRSPRGGVDPKVLSGEPPGLASGCLPPVWERG